MTSRGPADERVRRAADPGVTLVELVIAVALSMVVSGVIAATLFTSLNVADTTAGMVADSTDESLLSTYLARDAQAAAGTDPATAARASGAGITVPPSGGWGSCAQVGTLVVRFDWIDRGATTDRPVTVTWAVDAAGDLVRRACQDGTTVDLVLARSISSVNATCSPDPACGGYPTSLWMTVRGGSARVPTEYTLTAALRGDVQAAPSATQSAPVPMLVLGEQSATRSCPVLQLDGTGPVSVRGDVVVSSACGAAPVSGDQTLLRPVGRFETLSGVDDPYVDLAAPTADCTAGSGLAPGRSTGASTVTVHTAPVTLSGTVTFEPGRHVFCGGVSLTATASVSGTGVLWYVPAGGVQVASGATLDLAPASSGPYANLLVWSVGTSPVSVSTGSTVANLRGVVYAPRARVSLSTDLAAHLGGVVSAEQRLVGPGAVRVGLPIPSFTIAPTSLTTGQSGVAYPSTSVVVSGGTAPVSYAATGLPAGLSMSSTGAISGTPTVSGSFTVVVTASDTTGAWFRASLPLSVRTPVSISGPTSLADGTAGTAATPTTFTASGGLAPYTWSASGLPTGMTMSSGGVLSGTPTASGSYGVTVTVADAAAGVATRSYTLTIAQAVTGANPFTPVRRFQILTEGNATIGSYDVQGAVAVGGNVVFRNYQPVASVETSTFTPTSGGQAVGLVVGGTADLVASGSGSQLTVANGFFHLGSLGGGAITTWGTNVHLATSGVADNWSTPRVIVSSNQSNQTSYPVVSPGVFDTAGVFAQVRPMSVAIGALDPSRCSSIATPTVTTAYGNYTLTLVADRVNVWNVTLAQINAMGNVSGPTNPSATTPLVINVLDGGTVTLPNRYWEPLKNGAKSAILWNFPNAGAVNVTSVFYGSLLAPNAAVSIDNVTFQGDVVAKTATITSGKYEIAHWTTPIPCITNAPSVSGPATIPDGQVGIASSTTMQGVGGTPSYRWSASGLPPGLTMSSAGVLSGTPTTSGPYTIVASITDSAGATATRSYTTTIRAAPTVSAPSSLTNGDVGVAYGGATFAVTGGLAPYTWAASNLHDGLSLSTGGVLSGTPAANGTRTVTVTVTDAIGATASRDYSLTVTGVVCPKISYWKAELFDNATLASPTAACRDDAVVAFSWGTGAPATGVNADKFSGRWSRTQWFSAGTYRFTVAASDGFRLYVDDKKVLDMWPSSTSSSTTASASLSVDLTAGTHSVLLEYVDHVGTASVSLGWTMSAPSSCPAVSTSKWVAQIYDGTSLGGSVVECKEESAVDKDWGSGTPNSSVGNDTFSVRYTRQFTVPAGTYQLTATYDDGARVYVNGSLVIDDWNNGTARSSSASGTLPAGTYTVVMETYENTGSARAQLAIHDPSRRDISK